MIERAIEIEQKMMYKRQGRRRRDAEFSQLIQELWPTESFNLSGACTVLKRLFKIVLSTCSKLLKEELAYENLLKTADLAKIDQKTKDASLVTRRKKGLADGVLLGIVSKILN